MLRSLMTVSGLTLVSRVLGLLRDIVINHYLGVGATSDAWNAAFQFPNLFRRVFGEGAFNAAFVPQYTNKLHDGEESAFAYGNKIIVLLSMVLAVIFLLCLIFTGPIMKLFNWWFEPEKLELTISLARVTMGYLFFVCLLACFSGILNSHKRFFAPAFSYAFLNVALLSGLFIAVPVVGNPEKVLSWSLLAAGVLQLIVVVIPVLRLGLKVRFHMPKFDSDIKMLGLLMLPGVLSAGIQQINLLVGSWVVSAQDGGKTIIYNADRINQLPLGLIGIAFGVVLLPELTQKIKANQLDQAKQSIQTGMQHALFLTLPAMAGMLVLAEPMIFVLFKGGKFTALDAQLSSQALMAFAIGCPAYVLSRVVQPAYFARSDTRTPMVFTFASALVNAVLCLVAWFTLRDSGKLHIGCAVATSIAGWVNLILLVVGLRKSSLIALPMAFWLKVVKMLIVSGVMAVALYFAAGALYEQLHTDGRWGRSFYLLAIISISGIAYFGMAHFSKTMTFRELKGGFKR